MCDGNFLDKHVVKQWSMSDHPWVHHPWNVIPGDILITGASGNFHRVDRNDTGETVRCVSDGCGMTQFEITVRDLMLAGF